MIIQQLLRVQYFMTDLVFNGISFIKYYNETRRKLRKSGKLSRHEHDEKQFEELKKFVKYAYDHVPYYHQLFEEYEIDINNFSWKQYEKIPYLTKDIIVKEGLRLISDEYSLSQLEIHRTGGSTGAPTSFYFHKGTSLAVESAFIQNAYDMIGYKRWHRAVFFRGNMDFVSEKMVKEKCYWKRNHYNNGIVFSSSHINNETISFYKERLKKFNPQWFVARPSAIYYLFKSIGKDITQFFPSLKGLIFMSEGLYDYQIKYFKEIYPGIKMMHVYGHTEHGCFASTFDEAMHYQIYSEYGYSQFRELKGVDSREMVTTGFTNRCMPLIKYLTGDLFTGIDDVEFSSHPYHTFNSIIGRTQDVLVCLDNSYYTAVTLDFSDIDNSFFEKVIKYQFIQHEIGVCEMLLVLHNSEDLNYVARMVNLYLNSDKNRLDIRFRVVDDIQKSVSGKERLIVNNNISLEDLCN